MPRVARIVAVGYPHHIIQSGNYGQKIFADDNDRLKYLSWIQEYSNKYGLSILAYCLMKNHVHFVAIPAKEGSLARTFNTAHMRYSQYFNKKMKAKGHLWQGRFFSCVLDEPHLLAVSKYVERNPVRAKLVKKPWQWKWSSARSHINEEKPMIKLGSLFGRTEMPWDVWKEYIGSEETNKAIAEIRRYTRAGRPLGTDDFVRNLERKFGKALKAPPKGRPTAK